MGTHSKEGLRCAVVRSKIFPVALRYRASHRSLNERRQVSGRRRSWKVGIGHVVIYVVQFVFTDSGIWPNDHRNRQPRQYEWE